MAVGVIVNRVAGANRAGRLWGEVAARLEGLPGPIEVVETKAVGDAARLAAGFTRNGVGLVVAVGGDGTVSEVVDGLMSARRDGATEVALAVVPAGTGSDFARGFRLGGTAAEIARRIAGGPERRIDVGLVSFTTPDGVPVRRHFVNIASLGLSGATVKAVNAARAGSRLPGKLLFLAHTVRELVRYRFQAVRIRVDGGAPISCDVALVAIANGRFFGGGMMIAPDARADDGLAEIVIVRGASKPSLIRDLRLIYSGAHRGHPACTFLRGRTVEVEPLDGLERNRALLDIDGECPGAIPAAFTILPRALTLRG
ncbi:MAG: diacylglycerol kinase family lipid kinase [Rhizobiaceae bacterium]|nr:diacylglycerol kinase family lipid kinase [Rhizobiaceae bacterium]